MTPEDAVAGKTVEYYRYLSGHGGTDPETLLAGVSSHVERRELLDSMDDVDWLWELTAPLRDAARETEHAQACEGPNMVDLAAPVPDSPTPSVERFRSLASEPGAP